MLIDIHTHTEQTAINNEVLVLLDKRDFFGIHPWFINPKTYHDDLINLEHYLKSRPIAMIGETGLDRLKSEIDFDIQKEVFIFHLKLSMELARPVVLHVLRAHSEVLAILKDLKFNQKLLIHDYSGGESELRKYLNFDAYFSFGKSLFRQNSKATVLFTKISKDRIFLETDDELSLSIEEVYEKAKELRPDINIENQILNNFLNFFYSYNHCASDVIKNICATVRR